MADRTRTQRAIRHVIIHPLQGAAILLAFAFCRLAPITWGSAFGSFMFRLIGPRLRGQRVAERNLKMAFPDLTEHQIDAMIKKVWDNLGRGAGEWASVDLIDTTGSNSRVTIEGEEEIAKLKESGKPFIAFGGHFANWEIGSLIFAQRGLPLVTIYRPASIPAVEFLFKRIRSRFMAELIPKNRGQMRHIIEAIRAGHPLGIMADQKLNEGIAVPFFGRNAMTPPVPAELALRYKCPLVPVLAERLPGVRFRFRILPPLELPTEGTHDEKVFETLVRMNAVLESWISDHPDQWFWVHRRWPD